MKFHYDTETHVLTVPEGSDIAEVNGIAIKIKTGFMVEDVYIKTVDEMPLSEAEKTGIPEGPIYRSDDFTVTCSP